MQKSYLLGQKFDYVVMSDLVGHLHDIQQALEQSRTVMTPHSRLIITYYNFMWEPFLILAEKLHLKAPQPRQNWINTHDLENLLNLARLRYYPEWLSYVAAKKYSGTFVVYE